MSVSRTVVRRPVHRLVSGIEGGGEAGSDVTLAVELLDDDGVTYLLDDDGISQLTDD
jgi:hypothetical protein